ncbi:hypothetical protein HMPREF1624_07509 [Sporothrix schenckii ATCC 58251]|uniref:alpha-1,2-Mannosidase n=1 Tax=Sporothrix schenckii (strain ATCC 58251 / de Perez 2211183) TaxID=1391915 RepID=U7PMM4_SPOS1|nr:hypothetical protein HMPREF1624_07509 [Sporothrix schenckii ATCC 58251]
MAVLLSAISLRRKTRLLVSVAAAFLLIVYVFQPRAGRVHLHKVLQPARESTDPIFYVNSSVNWALRQRLHPIPDASLVRLPTGTPAPMPAIQYNFRADPDYKSADVKLLRDTRRDAIRSAFLRAWESYRQHAWGYDELLPIKLKGKDGFSGWGATLVDALDTLWIMDLRNEFDEAVRAVATIDWDAATGFECSLFETNIRYLGGLLSAYEMSGATPLLDKAKELAHMLLAAFDTASHMPANRFHFDRAWQGLLVPGDHEASAAVGTLSLEFTKLAQLTGDHRFYDAIDRIKRALAQVQDTTTIPGLWPTFLDLQNGFKANGQMYTLGGMADSLYEYLPKMHMLLGGQDAAYRDMYVKAADAARQHLLFRPMIPDPDVRGHDILVSGTVLAGGPRNGVSLMPEGQHLACFAGGMFALGGKLFDRPADVEVGTKLTQGCIWAYDAFPTGVMPESFDLVPCPKPSGWLDKMALIATNKAASAASAAENTTACPWDEPAWRAAQFPKDKTGRYPPGFAAIRDPRYLLRPEAVESVFLLYRITGDRSLQEAAWRMYLNIERSTATKHANSAIADVTVTGPPQKLDSMESFWFAETLKYLYLTFTEPDYFSLDDYVYNTEAHPFKIPKPAAAPLPPITNGRVKAKTHQSTGQKAGKTTKTGG